MIRLRCKSCTIKSLVVRVMYDFSTLFSLFRILATHGNALTDELQLPVSAGSAKHECVNLKLATRNKAKKSQIWRFTLHSQGMNGLT